MEGRLFSEFSQGDIAFLLETIDPRLLTKIDTIKNDPVIIERMLSQEADKLFRRIMVMGEGSVLASISSTFFFEVLLRKALIDLGTRSYTI